MTVLENHDQLVARVAELEAEVAVERQHHEDRRDAHDAYYDKWEKAEAQLAAATTRAEDAEAERDRLRKALRDLHIANNSLNVQASVLAMDRIKRYAKEEAARADREADGG